MSEPSNYEPQRHRPERTHDGALGALVTWVGAALFVALAAGLTYSNCFDVPLVFDDNHLLERVELHATAIDPAQLSRAALGFPLRRWLPFVTFAANHALHGLRPWGYHAFNVAIHVANALLFLALAARLLEALRLGEEGRRRAAAIVAALLFALHPVQTMAVTYVIQRMTSLGTLFALASVLLWLRARRGGGLTPPSALGALACWYLAVSCKESFAVLPALILLVEWCAGLDLRAEVRRRPLLWCAVATGMAAAGAFLLAHYWPTILAERRVYGGTVGERLLTQPRVLWHYLSLLALPLPSRLHVDYAWLPSSGLLSPLTTLPALVGVLALAAISLLARARAPLVTLAIGWFLVALAIEQSVLPVDYVFEHRLYFASLGLFVAAGWATTSVRPERPWVALALALPIVASLAAGTRLRNEVWRDPQRLFTEAVSAGPRGARALINAAVAARRAGRLADARAMFMDAAARDPAAVEPLANLGNIAAQEGLVEEAERRYREALLRDPRNSDVLYNLAVLLAEHERPEEAIALYERAIAAAPRNSDARVNLAMLIAERRHDPAAALALLDETLRLDAGSTLALMNRALLLADAGRPAEGLRDARQALALVPESADARYAQAWALATLGRTEEARASTLEALRIAPGHADARRLLACLEPGDVPRRVVSGGSPRCPAASAPPPSPRPPSPAR